MIRIEHLPADVFGLSTVLRAALTGGLREQGVATCARDLAPRVKAFEDAQRAQVSRWLEACATSHAPHVAVLDSIRALAQPTTRCVVHEAQPAILSGPLQQLVGTLQTVVLAKHLSTPSQAVIPVLWVLADEPLSKTLSSSPILNRSHVLQTVQLDELERSRKPLRQIELQAERHGTGALHAVLSQLFGDQAHIAEALSILVPRAGESLPGAFTRAMYELFGAQGLVIIDPQDFREELTRACADCLASPLMPALSASAQSLHARFGLQPDLQRAWLFRQDPGGRQALYAGGEGYQFHHEPGSRTRVELVAELVQSPRDWQAGHWLQSLARAALLPIVAEVGAESELERHLLLGELRAERGWPQPGFVLRAHLSLLGEPQRKALERLDLSLVEVLMARGKLHSQAGRAGPRALFERLTQLKAQTRAQLAAEKSALLDLDPRLASVLRVASRDIGRTFARLIKKIEHLEGDQAGKRGRHERCLANSLCPAGEPQETRLSPFSWVASHGLEWIGELARELDPFCCEHLAVHLG